MGKKNQKEIFFLINKWLNFLKLGDLIIFSSFPFLGYAISYKKIWPLSLLCSSFLLSLGINIDNRVEGYNKNPMDISINGSPLLIKNYLLNSFKIARFILYLSSLSISLIFAPKAFFWVFLSLAIAILYNNNKIFLQIKPFLDLIFHILGAWAFTVAGGSWHKLSNLTPHIFGIAFGFWLAGGYLNHILEDKEKDEKIGKKTFAHLFEGKKIRIGTLIFFLLGDILIFFIFFGKNNKISFFVLAIIFITILISLKIKNPKSFKISYRIIYSLLTILILLNFIFPSLKYLK